MNAPSEPTAESPESTDEPRASEAAQRTANFAAWVPGYDGSLQWEIHTGGYDIEVWIDADGSIGDVDVRQVDSPPSPSDAPSDEARVHTDAEGYVWMRDSFEDDEAADDCAHPADMQRPGSVCLACLSLITAAPSASPPSDEARLHAGNVQPMSDPYRGSKGAAPSASPPMVEPDGLDALIERIRRDHALTEEELTWGECSGFGCTHADRGIECRTALQLICCTCEEDAVENGDPVNIGPCDPLAIAAALVALRGDVERLAKIRVLVDEQAADEALWFHAERISEAYLQSALRRLHRMIEEGIDDD